MKFGARAMAGVIVGASLAAYVTSFWGTWVFDDFASVVGNPTIREWRTAWAAPGGGITVSGRPVLNASLALSYAISGAAPWGHHLVNWVIHTAAGLALFGAVRRTLELPSLAKRWGGVAVPVAGLAALLWTAHPVQTEAVTYVVQRAESLMGLCLLVTLYAYVRSLTATNRAAWQTLAVGACMAGVGTKEVMVAAPVLVLLHDRAFAGGSWRGAGRARGWFYAALFATWVPLAALVISTGGNRGGSAGFGEGVNAVAYWLTQPKAIVHYLSLAVWPAPLVFEYGTFWVNGVGAEAVGVLALVGATGWALWRNTAAGLLGAWFFILLAPTSIMPGTTQMIVEHRMYLPLASLAVAVVVGLWIWGGRRVVAIGGAVAVAGVALTAARNLDYRSEVFLWTKTLAQRPGNATAHDSLAVALARAGRADEALAHLAEAARLAPGRVDYLANYATALERAGRREEAIARFEEVVRRAPGYGLAHINFGLALKRAGRVEDAMRELETGVRLAPEMAEARSALGGLMVDLGRTNEALPQLVEAVRLAPGLAGARVNLGVALVLGGRAAEAVPHLETALQLNPTLAEAENGLGLAMIQLGRTAEAGAHFEAAVRLRLDYTQARDNLERWRGLMAAPR